MTKGRTGVLLGSVVIVMVGVGATLMHAALTSSFSNFSSDQLLPAVLLSNYRPAPPLQARRRKVQAGSSKQPPMG